MRGKKNQMTSKLGMSQVKHRETISRFPKGGKRARDTKCGRTDYWCQILPEKKTPDIREKLRKLNPSRINLCLGLI